MSRQRVWYAADALFTSDPKIAELGDEFGPAGPLTIVVLHGLAKLQNDHGRLRSRHGIVMRSTFMDSTGPVHRVLDAAARLGVIADLSHEESEFTCRFPHWDRWQKSNDAVRKSRERDDAEKETDAEKRAIERVFNVWKETLGVERAKLTKQRRTCIRARLRAGYNAGDIARAILGCAGSDFHMGRGAHEGNRFNDLTLICKNDQKLEEFMARPAGSQSPEMPDDDDPEAMYA